MSGVLCKDKSDKKYAMFRHSVKNLRIRYGIRADEELYFKLCKYIKNAKGNTEFTHPDGTRVVFVDKQSCTRSVWRIYFKDKCIIAAYDKTRHILCTVLPANLKDEDIIYKRWLEEE
jgi:hypothetical protein